MLKLTFYFLFIYLQTFRDLLRLHGEKIIGLEVPCKDLFPMVRAGMSGNELNSLKTLRQKSFT